MQSEIGGKLLGASQLNEARYVSQADIKHFGSSAKRQEIMSINGWLGQEWIAK